MHSRRMRTTCFSGRLYERAVYLWVPGVSASGSRRGCLPGTGGVCTPPGHPSWTHTPLDTPNGQQAGGKAPTGMLSCFLLILSVCDGERRGQWISSWWNYRFIICNQTMYHHYTILSMYHSMSSYVAYVNITPLAQEYIVLLCSWLLNWKHYITWIASVTCQNGSLSETFKTHSAIWWV